MRPSIDRARPEGVKGSRYRLNLTKRTPTQAAKTAYVGGNKSYSMQSSSVSRPGLWAWTSTAMLPGLC